jgi:hypothetical protein
MKVRFNLNQIGLTIECAANSSNTKNPKWICAVFWGNKMLEDMGGAYGLKHGVLSSLHMIDGEHEVVPPGTYHEEGRTVTCI